MSFLSPKASTRRLRSEIPVKIIGLIHKSNFMIFLVHSEEYEKYLAMKVFPYKENYVSIPYAIESKAFDFNHPNLIRYITSKDKIWTNTDNFGNGHYSSYILMELAPNGDLADMVMNKKLAQIDKLIRTIFHHIIEAVRYLHAKKFAHLDIKMENILLGEGFMPKLTDFESLCPTNRKGKVPKSGTKNYRSPEMRADLCFDPLAADIYSLGILLVVLQFGEFPYLEDSLFNGHDLQKYLNDGDPAFWKYHPSGSKVPDMRGKAFKDLVFGMTRGKPSDRMNLEQVMENAWFKGPIYMNAELNAIMKQSVM